MSIYHSFVTLPMRKNNIVDLQIRNRENDPNGHFWACRLAYGQGSLHERPASRNRMHGGYRTLNNAYAGLNTSPSLSGGTLEQNFQRQRHCRCQRISVLRTIPSLLLLSEHLAEHDKTRQGLISSEHTPLE